MKKHWTILLLLVCFLALAVASFSAGGVAADTPLRINEVRIDQPSNDNDEYFELAGDPGREPEHADLYCARGRYRRQRHNRKRCAA